MAVRVMREVLQCMLEEVLVWVVVGLVRRIVEGSLGLSESSGKASHTVCHSFSNPISLSLSLAWKLKGIRCSDFLGWDEED